MIALSDKLGPQFQSSARAALCALAPPGARSVLRAAGPAAGSHQGEPQGPAAAASLSAHLHVHPPNGKRLQVIMHLFSKLSLPGPSLLLAYVSLGIPPGGPEPCPVTALSAVV